ncbi:MAG: AmmeMemoRadiSam system protein B, partial [Thermodesulfobacteriota bacterium]
LCLQDPLNISEKVLFLPLPIYFIISHFDGKHSIVDIQAEYMRRFGEFLFTEKIQEIVHQLNENLFLEGERFQQALRKKEEEFLRSPVREPAFAGKSYEGDPERLKAQLEGYFTRSDGPGKLRERGKQDGLKGVIAPHIDFQRGGFCYAFSHKEVWERSSSQCFIILGTSHTPMRNPYCLTRKDFITPLGPLKVDQEMVKAIQSKCPYDLLKDEGVQRSEHSIEFQCLFLRYLFPEPFEIKIVPVLCGSLEGAIERGISPIELEPVRQFIEALKNSLLSLKEEVCFIASADLAHIGLQFGDREGINEYSLRVLESEDREMLSYVERMDGEGFFSSVSKERDRRRICGLSAIYTLLQGIEAKEGRLLKYAQAFTPETQSVVTFASMAFY